MIRNPLKGSYIHTLFVETITLVFFLSKIENMMWLRNKNIYKQFKKHISNNNNLCKQFFSTYEIQIITGDKRGASTSSNVFVSLYDNNNNEYKVPVDPTTTFERNEMTTLLLENSDIKSLDEICKIRVGHDGENEVGSGWFLDRVIISSEDSNNNYNKDENSKTLHYESDNNNNNNHNNNNDSIEFFLHGWIGKSDSGGVDGPLIQDIDLFDDNAHVEEVFDINALPAQSPYKLDVGGFCIPHPEKVKQGEKAVCTNAYGYGGEDAYFTLGKGGNFIGIADGIYEWRDRGIDAGLFSRALMTGASEYATDAIMKDKFVTSKDLFRAAAAHARNSGLQGSSTLCIFGLIPYEGFHEMKDDMHLNYKMRITKLGKRKIYPTHFDGNETINDILSSMLNNVNGSKAMVGQVTNLGDSGILVGRPSTGEILFRTPQQEHDFGFPYQLGHEGIADGVDDAEVYLVGNIIEGDVIIAGSDGLFDNLSDVEILSHASNFPEKSPQQISMQLINAAFEKSIDKKADTPYSNAATEEFNIIYRGGKKDDIACVVSRVSQVKE